MTHNIKNEYAIIIKFMKMPWNSTRIGRKHKKRRRNSFPKKIGWKHRLV